MAGVSVTIGAENRMKAGLDAAKSDVRKWKADVERIASTGVGGGGPSGMIRGGSFGGRNTGYIGGQLAMQAQDVAVMAQMGASTSRIIAQQGSQILSIFGPHGAIAGGVLAIGAGIAGWATNTELAEQKAKALDDQWKEILAKVQATQKAAQESAKHTARIGKGPNEVAKMNEEDRHKAAMKEIEATRDSGVRAHAREVEEERHAKEMAEINKRIDKEKTDAAKKSADEMARNTAAIKAEQKAREEIALARKSDAEKDAAALREIAELNKELAQPITGTDQSKVVESERKRTRIAQLQDSIETRREKREADAREANEKSWRAQEEGQKILFAKQQEEEAIARKRAVKKEQERFEAEQEEISKIGMTGKQAQALRKSERTLGIGDKIRAAREVEKIDRERRIMGKGALSQEERAKMGTEIVGKLKDQRTGKLVEQHLEDIKKIMEGIDGVLERK